MYIRILALSNSENDAITIVKTVLFMIVNTMTIVSFMWVCSIYQFINIIIKSKEHVFAKVVSMVTVFTTDYTSYDSLYLCQSNWQVFHKYPINLL